jgi:prepilin-type N-terminal cleavage/methylation domain-containing protein
MKKGFTLIELLIVVAIIAILAAIAIPNFLDAQVRSKVSRVKADMRTIAVALEAYTVDKNRVPREINTGWYAVDLAMYGDAFGILWWGLTTPLPYLTRVDYIDPFQDTTVGNRLDERRYTYHDLVANEKNYATPFWTAAIAFYGGWRLGSVGPDRMYGHGFTTSAQLVYDPTNGTNSLGNIWRSQNYSFDKQPPVGVLLGVH